MYDLVRRHLTMITIMQAVALTGCDKHDDAL